MVDWQGIGDLCWLTDYLKSQSLFDDILSPFTEFGEFGYQSE